MFGFIPISEQAVKERAKTAALTVENEKNAANIDYIAMMCDIDLDNDGSGSLADEFNEGDQFYTPDGSELVFKGVDDDGAIIAERAESDEAEEVVDGE